MRISGATREFNRTSPCGANGVVCSRATEGPCLGRECSNRAPDPQGEFRNASPQEVVDLSPRTDNGLRLQYLANRSVATRHFGRLYDRLWPGTETQRTLYDASHRLTSTNERDRHLQSGRSWTTDPDHRGADGVERLLTSGEAAPCYEVRSDQAPDSDPSASHFDSSTTSAVPNSGPYRTVRTQPRGGGHRQGHSQDRLGPAPITPAASTSAPIASSARSSTSSTAACT
jgi:hypothetical protein